MRNGRAKNNYQSAFTLIELLVVISIIAMLLAILMPSLGMVKKKAKAVVCMTNLRNIAPAVVMYSMDNDDRIHRSPNGGIFYKYNTNHSLQEPINPDFYGNGLNTAAYWGVILNNIYLEDREVFMCPSSKMVDDYRDHENKDLFQLAHYGINGYYKYSGRKMSSFRRPSEMVYAQDHMEHRLDNNGDTLFIFPGHNTNLPQWRPGHGSLGDVAAYDDPIKEVYRHSDKCNTIWLDGHVASIEKSDGSDVKASWYVGGDKQSARVSWPY